MRRALEATANLRSSIYLSLNASPATVTSPGFNDTLALAAGRPLVIEITEHAAIEDYDKVARGLSTILRRGGKLAVDDAGAGFASLRHILRLSPNIIKLDRSVIADLDRDVGARAMARALIEFAETTGTSIVAEGIERKEELESLRALGVGFGQGYHLGRPMPLVDLQAFLEPTPTAR
jgi:EAL domain-containing protein (putative c-di-GMP-specific phosphodiesterase class I)